MNLQEAYQICPSIRMITVCDLKQAAQKVSGDKSFRLDFTKTFYDQGFSELCCIEIIMELESKLDISIHDEVVDFILYNPYFFLQEFRESKINKLLND